jgi:hypothetical protein
MAPARGYSNNKAGRWSSLRCGLQAVTEYVVVKLVQRPLSARGLNKK